MKQTAYFLLSLFVIYLIAIIFGNIFLENFEFLPFIFGSFFILIGFSIAIIIQGVYVVNHPVNNPVTKDILDWLELKKAVTLDKGRTEYYTGYYDAVVKIEEYIKDIK